MAPDVGASQATESSPGGYVMDSQPGLYDNVLVFDFKSLYPSISRTFVIAPLGLALGNAESGSAARVEGFKGASFSRSEHLLPGLLAEWWQARDAARRDGDTALGQAIKILMNSCYGVLGSPGCRFFDPRLASSITLRGHQIIRQSKAFIEQCGYRVIYGDTDSLFVWLQQPVDEQAAAEIGRIGHDQTVGERIVKGQIHRFDLIAGIVDDQTHHADFALLHRAGGKGFGKTGGSGRSDKERR